MKTTLAVLAATTALSATFGLPASGALSVPVRVESTLATGDTGPGRQALPLIPVSGDDEDDDDDEGDDEEGDDDDECEDDDGACPPAGNSAPTGTTAPPANGLFGNGAPPKVQMN